VYHALARLCGLTEEPDPVRWKRENQEARNRMKSLQLGINYGMGVPSLARGLNRHPLIASGIIERHRREYPRYWEWRDGQALSAKLHRCTESIFGWPLRITTSPNVRTLYNFPMQSGGAEMLRLAAWQLHRAGLKTCMLIHDGVLLELNSNEELEHAKEIMVAAGFDVCPGLRIDAEPDQLLTNGARYRDKRPVAKAMWKTMMHCRALGLYQKANCRELHRKGRQVDCHRYHQHCYASEEEAEGVRGELRDGAQILD
jgi:hypothetical protein